MASIGATCPIVYIIMDAFDRKIIARIEVVHEPGGRESIICGKVILGVHAVNRLAQRVGALGGVAGFVPAMLAKILLDCAVVLDAVDPLVNDLLILGVVGGRASARRDTKIILPHRVAQPK